MIVWIIGKSASGKTTVGRCLHSLMKYSGQPWILLDGDIFRACLGDETDHSIEGRKKNSEKLARFCIFLDTQRINVIAPILSIFEEDRDLLRNSVAEYFEVYLKVADAILFERDDKNLYSQAQLKKIKNVVGFDIPFPEPKRSDLVLDDLSSKSPEAIVDLIVWKLPTDIPSTYIYSNENLIERPQSYQYSEYFGERFLNDFTVSRERFRQTKKYVRLREAALLDLLVEMVRPRVIDERKKQNFLTLTDLLIKSSPKRIDAFIKSFELRKRVYETYDEHLVPDLDSQYDNINGYLFALYIICKESISETQKQRKIILINTLLKLTDTTLSIAGNCSIDYSEVISICVEIERRLIVEFS